MATECNDTSIWDTIWGRPEESPLETWRKHPGVFGRIGWLVENASKETRKDAPYPPTFVDLGCGVGVLLNSIRERMEKRHPNASYVGVDHSDVGLSKAKGVFPFIETHRIDLEATDPEMWPKGDILFCTETLEHLSPETVKKVLEYSTHFSKVFLTVPNWSLGPDEEAMHLHKWTAKEFLDLVKEYHELCRVECLGYSASQARTNSHHGYLLAACGYDKPFRLSVTMPVKNEEDDIERVLTSFRGAADEIVIGIDDLSDDRTEEIVKRYADKIVYFTWENDFSKARNACIEACTGDWIFMTEGHESLHKGLQPLLQLDEVPPFISVLEVRREAENNSWYFPWLFRNHKGFKFQNAVHNALTYYEPNECAKATQISTWHKRSRKKSIARSQQRRTMNKQEMLRRIHEEGNIRDMYYLGSEYRDLYCKTCKGQAEVPAPDNASRVPCPDCAMPSGLKGRTVSTGVTPFGLRQSMHWLRQFVQAARPCTMRYQARLSLAECYRKLERWADAKEVLMHATLDDATRTEHWYALGEMHEELGDRDLAMRFFEMAALGVGRPPVSYMFLDKRVYTYLPVQKLAANYAELGRVEEALEQAKRVPILMPEWASPEAMEEARRNIETLERRVKERQLENEL
jgi:hypothetical protein